jgi:hypothetical protein
MNGKYMKMYTKFWSENLKEIDHFKDIGIDGRITSIFIICVLHNCLAGPSRPSIKLSIM